jgi:hypothetical protein
MLVKSTVLVCCLVVLMYFISRIQMVFALKRDIVVLSALGLAFVMALLDKSGYLLQMGLQFS